MTAELAVVLPAVLLVLAGCLGALRLGVEQGRLDAAAAVVARGLARGDPPAAAIARGTIAGAASIVVQHRSGLVCVRAAAPMPVLGLPITVAGAACALEP
ncbi:TadE family type IV pilus minor pilin [Amnibacterium sp.]|uniref:TadE family type IV pilus minor pilin n=1 Tax=Amnibacterium sp. TaxID=1872496 RepID=UPI00262F930C|nr:TadE family type IV pilus minor pilin [Amnibacterium sp.]